MIYAVRVNKINLPTFLDFIIMAALIFIYIATSFIIHANELSSEIYGKYV